MQQTTEPVTETAIRWHALVLDADPLAGEDDLWPDEDLRPSQPAAELLPSAFFRGLVVGLSLAAVGWAGIAAAAVALSRLLG